MKPILERKRIESLVHIFKTKRIGVLGDFALDGYWHAQMSLSQLSREAPLFNRPIVAEKYSPGGAANVAWNLASLNIGEVEAFTVLGKDWRSSILSSIMKDFGIDMDGVVTTKNWLTPFFGKVILSAFGNQQEDARFDFINQESLPVPIQELLIDKILQKIDGLSAMIIADYNPQGVMGDLVIEELNIIAKYHPETRFIVDSRERLSRYKAMAIKPNEVEANQLFNVNADPKSMDIETLSQAGMEWQKLSGHPVYITLGDQGCLLCQSAGCTHIPTIPVPPPIDTVGAGDSFLAGLTAALVGGLSPEESVFFANLVAAVTVQKIGITGTASLEEILSEYDRCF